MDGLFFNKIFPVLIGIAMILWFYCIWFFNKYDKNTNRLLILIFFNIYYVPFYLFRIRKIKKVLRVRAISEEMYNLEFIKMSRESILETLEIWTNKELFINLEMENEGQYPIKELFQQWKTVYHIDKRILEEAFNKNERELLHTFNDAIMICDEKMADAYSSSEMFTSTNDWKILNKLAIEIMKDLN